MEYLGTKNNSSSIATTKDAEGGRVYVTTFGIPTYLSWKSGDKALKICGCSALMDGCTLALFRYKRRRTGSKQGRKRMHGWHDCTDAMPYDERFVIVGSGDVREIRKLTGSANMTPITPAEYQERRDEGVSLKYRCAFAIMKDGVRASDFMHFTISDDGVYGAW